MFAFWFSSIAITVYGLSLLALAEIIDLTIVAIALPQIMGALSVDFSAIALVSISYAVAAAIFIPLSGTIVQKYGMKRVVLICTIIFGVFSALCGMASSLSEMVIFRFFQGMGGAFFPSIAQAYIAETYAGDDKKKMMALFGAILVMGTVLGPILGGEFSAKLSWRWIFYINIPACSLSFGLIWLYMKKDKTYNVSIDAISFIFWTIGIGSLVYFICRGNSYGWLGSIKMVMLLSFSILILIFFVWRGLLRKSVINFSLFRNRNFVFSCCNVFVFTFVLTATMSYFPTMLQKIYDYPVNLAGYATVSRGVIALFIAPFIPLIARRIGGKLVMLSGLVGFACSCLLISHLSLAMNSEHLFIIMGLQGASMMAFLIPLMDICFIGFGEDEHIEASGIFNFFRNFSCSVGTPFFATLLTQKTQINYHNLGQHLSVFSDGPSSCAQSSYGLSDVFGAATLQGQLLFQSLFLSYLNVYYLLAIVLFSFMWLPFFLKESR